MKPALAAVVGELLETAWAAASTDTSQFGATCAVSEAFAASDSQLLVFACVLKNPRRYPEVV